EKGCLRFVWSGSVTRVNQSFIAFQSKYAARRVLDCSEFPSCSQFSLLAARKRKRTASHPRKFIKSRAIWRPQADPQHRVELRFIPDCKHPIQIANQQIVWISRSFPKGRMVPRCPKPQESSDPWEPWLHITA